MAFPFVAALVVAVAGCGTDLWSRRVPNLLTFGGAAGAVAFHLTDQGASGLGLAAGGWLVGGLLFLPLYVLRGMGGGDVKLMAALGAWIGPGLAVWLALYAALAGGVLALIVAIAGGRLRQSLANVWSILVFWRVAGVQPHPVFTIDSTPSIRLPYAVPIAVGLGVTLWLR